MIGHRLRTPLEVERPHTSGDGAGGRTVVIAQVGTIKAQVSQPTAEERAAAQQWGGNLTHVVHTLAGADVQRGDLLVGDVPSQTGARLRVIATVANSRSSYLRVECEAVQAEGA